MSQQIEFREAKKGKIQVGILADLVLLSQAIFAIDLLEISNIEAALTIYDGRIVFG